MKQFKGFERNETKEFEVLPKGAYVIKILNAKEEQSNDGGSYLKIAFDIAEGEYAGFYKKAFENSSKEDKKWPADGTLAITCPDDNSEQWIIDSFNKFMTAVEDSNDGYHWGWDESTLKDKLVGAKFHNKQSEFNGYIYDHIRPKWFISAQKVRDGKYGKMPADKLITKVADTSSSPANNLSSSDDEEIPF